jgi:predicted TIM-barrel fold metal-dependent hydrolase
MDPLFDRAAALGVPMLILTKASRLPGLAALLDRHDDLDVVIDHMADCPLDDAKARERLLDMARYPRVYVKISHTWGLSQEAYPWRDAHGLVRDVADSFGRERIMWGTDWPVCLQEGVSYSEPLTVVRNEIDFFTYDDLEWVMRKTVLRLWPFDG